MNSKIRTEIRIDTFTDLLNGLHGHANNAHHDYVHVHAHDYAHYSSSAALLVLDQSP